MQLVTVMQAATDLCEPVIVGDTSQVLQCKELSHLAGGVIPHSLQNELSLGNLH